MESKKWEWMGWDKWMVIIGQQSSKSTSGVYIKIKTPQVSSTNQLNGVDLDEDGELCGVADRDLVPSPSLHLVLVDDP